MSNVIVLTGAGISAESGIKTFRDSNGLWENHRVEDVASPEGFIRNPNLVWDFYKQRYTQSISVEPNGAHLALVKLEKHLGDKFHIITQNVDCLHTRAGSRRIYEMHGRLDSCFCTRCRTHFKIEDIDLAVQLPHCELCGALLRPDIVWFGEIPYYLYEIEELLKNSDYFLIIGTSGVVYPAAGFVMTAKLFGAHTIGINLEKPDNMGFFDEFHLGKCGELLPPIVDEMIKHL
ncbi:MAG: NAD-dependent deacylase [Candidatus Cloacimonetes bacterium]|jgi:NAD-dependent deacetylase|nr:NAD-dependent deacylase [Candidatus Cloacimonadota bacterium]MCK9333950.1 NAD-dependent deacylase [Candidatus Cloacimonadota bacterium]MDD2542857.1 NAD-dependent deacylase [Candidatus Cloacimonadota bacterium]MDD3096138.1 NAD-dependent deacylase [Candidatus Cloacimonadota bacterium]MDY0336309.1 NAD-dependent deacylase [Candidatus Cloacimonadaceae bacterium]